MRLELSQLRIVLLFPRIESLTQMLGVNLQDPLFYIQIFDLSSSFSLFLPPEQVADNLLRVHRFYDLAGISPVSKLISGFIFTDICS